MRSITRCLRKLQPALNRQKYIFPCSHVEAQHHHHFRKACSNSAYGLANHAEASLFSHHTFTISRVLSTHAASLTSQGSFLFQTSSLIVPVILYFRI